MAGMKRGYDVTAKNKTKRLGPGLDQDLGFEQSI